MPPFSDDVREARRAEGAQRHARRRAALPPRRPRGSGPGAKVETAKAPGRCVSTSCGEPPRPAAVHAWSRAIVSASRSGEGSAGSSSENCAGARGRRLGARGEPGDRVARRVRLEVEQHERAPGARLARGRGRPQHARVRRVPSTSPSSTASEAALRPRAARVAQSGSSTRESRNASGSRPSTGQSSSSVVSKRSGNGAGTRTPSSSPRARRTRRGPSGPKRSARATGGRRARSPIVRRPQRCEELLPLRRQAQESERQGRERRRLPPRGHDGEPRARPREDERRRAREGEGRLGLDRAGRGRVEKGLPELLRASATGGRGRRGRGARASARGPRRAA